MDPSKMDVRTVQRYLKKGQVDRDAFEKYLESLPDLAEQSTFVDYDAQFAEEQRKDAEAPAEPAVPVMPSETVPPPPVAVHPAHGFPPATAAPLPASPLSVTPPSVAPQSPHVPPLSPLPGGPDDNNQGG